jgi:hypothetical protein
MTEAEWLACDDPLPMLSFVQGKASDRKLRLFAAACCRHVWGHLLTDSGREAVEATERVADGLAGPHELTRIGPWRGVEQAQPWEPPRERITELLTGFREAWRVAEMAREVAWEAAGLGVRRREGRSQAASLRDLFGSPFRPAADPARLDPTSASLARAAYEERELPFGHLDPARLAVLSDALEEAGCADADLLSHLRSPGPYVRGCWALDLVLGVVRRPCIREAAWV